MKGKKYMGTTLTPLTQQTAEFIGLALTCIVFALLIIFIIWAFNTDRTEKKELAEYLEKLTPQERETINQYLIFKKKNAKLFKLKRKEKNK